MGNRLFHRLCSRETTAPGQPGPISATGEAADGRHIGDIDLHAINRSGRTAKLTVLVGDKSAWNCGFGTDAIRTVLRYAFADLGLEQVKLRVFNLNKRAVCCCQKCGFRKTWRTADDSWVSSRDAETHMAVAKKWFMADQPHADTIQAR